MPTQESKPFYDPPTDFEFITHDREKLSGADENNTGAKRFERSSSGEGKAVVRVVLNTR